MDVTSVLVISLYQEWKKRHYAFMRFLLERYYGNKRGIEKIAPIEVTTEDRLFTILHSFVEDTNILLSSVEKIKSTIH